MNLGTAIRQDQFDQVEAIRKAKSGGYAAVQIMTGDPKVVGKRSLTEEKAKEIKNIKENLKVFIHAGFLFNSGAPKNKFFAKMILEDLRLGELCGAIGVVIHVGRRSKVEKDPLKIEKNVTENIAWILERIPSQWSIKLIVETGSNWRSEFPVQLERLYQIAWSNTLGRARNKKMQKHFQNHLAFAIDSAHIYNAGYDIGNTWMAAKILDLIDKIFGDKVILCHFNDTCRDLAQGEHDIHSNILEGGMFIPGVIKVFCEWSKRTGVPLLLETPDKTGTLEKHAEEYKKIRLICVVGEIPPYKCCQECPTSK